MKKARPARRTAPGLRSTPLSSAPARPGLFQHQGGWSPPKRCWPTKPSCGWITRGRDPWLRRQSTGAEHRPSFTARSCRGPVVPSGRFEAQPTVGPLGLAATGGPTQPTDDSSDLLTPDQGPAAAAAQEEHPHAHATTPRPRLPPRDPYDAGRADPSQPGPRHLPRLQRPDRLRRRHHRPAVSSAAWTRTVRRAWTPGPQCWDTGLRVLCSRTAFFCALSRWAWVLAVVSPRMR
jgi:hypothetical protein